MAENAVRDVVIVGGGLAGQSAAIYLGRAMRDVVLVDAGHPMAVWEPEVQNYLGFPEGISGEALLERGKEQALEYGVEWIEDEVVAIAGQAGDFTLSGRQQTLRARRVLLATGIFHLPPDIPGVKPCIGNSAFFCKDCDGYRVQGKRIAIVGCNNEAVEYALSMLMFTSSVFIATNGGEGFWDQQHEAWLKEYEIPVHCGRIVGVEHEERMLYAMDFEGGRRIGVDCLFTTRGDIFHNALARGLGAKVDREGQICVDDALRTSVPGLYSAGCITPANCQMIIAAGQGATAAQAINRDLFEESLRTHSLKPYRQRQIEDGEVFPEIID